jgi:hypothetical protein
MLLLEYVKTEQCEGLIWEMNILQSGLVHYLSLCQDPTLDSADLEGGFTQWAQSETKRRVEVFGLCGAAAQTFLFDVLPAPPKNSIYLQLPCSPEAWATSTREDFEKWWTVRNEQRACLIPWLEDVISQADAVRAPEADDITSQQGYFLATLLSYRVAILSNVFLLGSCSQMRELELRRIG